MDFVENRKLQAYRIAGQFLRLKKNEVLEMRSSGDIVQESVRFTYTSAERVKDFFYFNDFYIVALLIIASLLYIIFYIE